MNKIEFIHYRSQNGTHGGATVAIKRNGANVRIRVEHCSKTAVFNKKIGRSVAAGRITAFENGREQLRSKIIDIVVNDPLDARNEIINHLAPEMKKRGYLFK